MSLRVASLDARWSLGRPEKREAVIDGVLSMSPDVLFVQEACHESDIRETGMAVARILRPLGYGLITGRAYEDADDRTDRHAALVAVKEGLCGSVGWVSMGFLRPTNNNRGRFVPEAQLLDPASGQQVHMIGMHADDRSVECRTGQFMNILDRLDSSQELRSQATVLVGVGNYMHPSDTKGLIWRMPGVSRVFHHFTPGEPHTPQSKFQRAVSIGRRFSEMALPDVAELIESRGFVDADPLHEATLAITGDRFPLINTAHLLTRNAEITDFRITKIRGVQHRMISGTVHTT